MKKSIFLIGILSINLFGFSVQELKEIYYKNFIKSDFLKVKEINNYYFILSSTTIKSDRDEIQKLTLISKYLLFNYLKKRDNNLSSISIKEFQSPLTWKETNKNYLFSFVKKDFITNIYIKSKEINSTIIDNEIEQLNKIKNKNLDDYQLLKNFYLIKGDMDNYNKTVDNIMELKFNEI